MTDAVMETLNDDEAVILGKALDGLRKFFRQYKSE